MSVIGSYNSGGSGGSGITTILGDIGSATGAAIVFTGGTTGLVFDASGSTVTLAFDSPIQVPDGGTGQTSFTDNVLLATGTTSTGDFQTIPVGTSGQILISQGPGLLPNWANASGSSIAITGDTGSPVSSGSFTFTGGSTGLEFNPSGTTFSLAWTGVPLGVPLGGTGLSSVTAHALLAGDGTNDLQEIIPGTDGQILLGSTSNNPAFVTPTATAGGNLSVTANATTLSYGIAAPVTFANGGTGRTSTPNSYALVCGPITAGTALQDVGAVGTSGQILASQGASSLPHWINAPSGTIDITGDSGGALTSASFTFTGGSTPFTFAGSGTTQTLTWNSTVGVANGGTGRSTLTLNAILLGNGTTGVNSVGPATNGQILIGTTSSAPTFITPTATAGGNLAVTANATTLSYGISSPVTLINGGTGNTSAPTAFSVVCGPTGAGTALQNVVGLGSSGQVLTSAGAGALPAWSNASASSISLTGDSGGALAGNAFTFTGGLTPFTFAGSGATQTLTWNTTVAVANGGTGRSTLTSNALLLGNGTSGINSVGPATNGQILIGTTSSAPTFITPTATAGGNLAVTANATTLSYGISAPVTLINGGTGNTAAPTAYALLCGPVAAGTALQDLGSLGTSGQILASQGAGSLPHWINSSPGSISITGDSGGALSSSSFTFTGSGTPFTFVGSGSTQTLTWSSVVTVAHGGTGLATLTANAVLLGNGTGNIASVGPATNGQILIGTTSSAPTFITPTATAGGNLAVTANATTLSYGISAPVTFANGGTGNTAAPTAYALVCGPTGAGTALQNVVGVGTAGQLLTSAGAGALPAWSNAAASSISLTGDSGGALTGNAFTLTGGATPFTFVGATSTQTLTWNTAVTVAHGGTGVATLTANAVLLGNGTGNVASVGPATNGQILIGTTSSAPTFITPTATAGGNLAVTANATTLSYGISAPVTFANGGTGRTTAPTAFSVICGQTGAGTALQNVVGVGSSGDVLTSNGAAALPTWQAASGGSISITGDSGGALSGSAFTFTGGSTPFTFVGATSTQTLTWNTAVAVANGGTGVATLTANAVLLGNGTGNVASVGPATNGQILIGTTSSAPTFITPTATAGGNLAVTANATTLSYGISAPVTFANGGTGNTSAPTAYSVVCGPTGAGTTLQNVSGVGSSGQVLTSNGAAALPTWQAATGSISITGTSGGAQTSSSFVFSGGSSGLNFVGSSNTFSTTFTGIQANGGSVSLAVDNASNAVSIGLGTVARNINIGNSAAPHLTTLGSSNTTANTTVKGGTGGLTLLPQGGNVSMLPDFLSTSSGATSATKNSRYAQIVFNGLTTAAQSVLGTGTQALTITNSFADSSGPSPMLVTVCNTNASGNGARIGLLSTVLNSGSFVVTYLNSGAGALGSGDVVQVTFWFS